MVENQLVRKLRMQAGHRILILNAPDGYIEGHFDFVQVFVHNRADVERYTPVAVGALKPGGLLWMAYPKKSSKVKTDITRDIGWESMTAAGMEGVAQVAIDETWSATRFRPSRDVKSRKGSS